MFIHRLLFALIFIACCLTTLTNGASLPNGEVEALRSIGNTLGKTDWNFNINPCDQGDTWLNQSTRYYANNVTCDCSFNNNLPAMSLTCKYIHIIMKIYPSLSCDQT
ncbi:hypothetical protein E1A91_D11G341700v1 [Gossypium mustelinum]|uniref:Leucine-rich repeat-containing N-terminal plant-type domain-containing protein n=1 Tax=Gossypium mustelinum TaxID=34275 RepID=A0A5D2SZE5_GOSMU|nr:hypothetical protein E1A91_D11G341700v1 [Gossypium mustelinum]